MDDPWDDQPSKDANDGDDQQHFNERESAVPVMFSDGGLMDFHFHNLPMIYRVRPWRAPAADADSVASVNATVVFLIASQSHSFRQINACMERATRLERCFQSKFE